MEPACFLLFLLVGGSAHALLPSGESVCNGTHEKSGFSVTLGAGLSIRVMANASGHRVQCKKVHPGQPLLVFTVKREKVMMEEAFGNRVNFFVANGTLSFSRVEKTDSGRYILEIFNSIGCSVKKLAVELDVWESHFSLLIPLCSALAALLVMVVLSCCLCRKRRRSGRSGSAPSREQKRPVEFWQMSHDRTCRLALRICHRANMEICMSFEMHFNVLRNFTAFHLIASTLTKRRSATSLSSFPPSPSSSSPPPWWKSKEKEIPKVMARVMRAAAGPLILLLLTLSPGGSQPCDATKEEARCYGPLGGEIQIQLVTSLQMAFTWKRGRYIYISNRNGGVIGDITVPRVSFSPDHGTAKIVQLEKSDAGNYNLLFYNQMGKLQGNRSTQLLIQAPITAVQLISQCLDGGGQSVWCTSDGDHLQYGWRLNQRDLPAAAYRLPGGKVTLEPGVSGRLLCSVANELSRQHREVDIVPCVFVNCSSNGTLLSGWMSQADGAPCRGAVGEGRRRPSDHSLPLVLGGVLSALVMLLAVALAVTYLRKKKAGGGGGGGGSDDEGELTYADIRVHRQPGPSVRVNRDLEVTYGQVKISQQDWPGGHQIGAL
ncbi:uncharacterized protein LOC144207727 [Stigmatopora nigra]